VKNGEPKKKSVALSYDREGAPTITASGEGLIAQEIIERARESDIPIVQDARLAGLLSHVPVGEQIPPELYQAVAEVLVFVMQLEQRLNQHG
jgi:flagellar biosynthesis protein